MQNKYTKGERKLVERPVIAIIAVVVGVAAMALTAMNTKTGLVPDEDTGTIFCTVSTPPGTSLSQTNTVMDQIDSMLKSFPAFQSRLRFTGYNFFS